METKDHIDAVKEHSGFRLSSREEFFESSSDKPHSFTTEERFGSIQKASKGEVKLDPIHPEVLVSVEELWLRHTAWHRRLADRSPEEKLADEKRFEVTTAKFRVWREQWKKQRSSTDS